MQILEEKLGAYCRFALFNAAGIQESGLSVIAAIDGENSQTGLIDVLGDICKETRKILAVPVTIGIGNNSAQLCRVSDSYKEAVNSLLQGHCGEREHHLYQRYGAGEQR